MIKSTTPIRVALEKCLSTDFIQSNFSRVKCSEIRAGTALWTPAPGLNFSALVPRSDLMGKASACAKTPGYCFSEMPEFHSELYF